MKKKVVLFPIVVVFSFILAIFFSIKGIEYHSFDQRNPAHNSLP